MERCPLVLHLAPGLTPRRNACKVTSDRPGGLKVPPVPQQEGSKSDDRSEAGPGAYLRGPEVIQVTASTVCLALSVVVVAVVAWAVSSDERTERVVSWIKRWRDRRDR